MRSEPRGPQLFLTRTAPEFLIELFKLEVPEVGQGLIEIQGAARDPGVRAKIAVRAMIRASIRWAPASACAVRACRRCPTRLSGERVDIILLDENPAQFVINAMSPGRGEVHHHG